MKLLLVVSPAANQDILEFTDHLARTTSPQSALRFLKLSTATLHSIAAAPYLGERFPSDHPRLSDVRSRSVDGFRTILVFYRPTTDQVEILRVMRGSRDVASILDE